MLKLGEDVSGYRVERQLFAHTDSSGFLVVGPEKERARLLVDHNSIRWNRSRRKQFQEQVRLLRDTPIAGTCRPFAAVEHQDIVGCLYPLPAGHPLSETDVDELTAPSILELIKDIATCLEVAHESGQIHGNLTLDTVCTDQGTFSCLADFALWSLIPLDFQTGIEPLFASPEQIRGEDPDITSDIYSLGCLLYYLLTRTFPYRGEDAFATGMLHLDGDFPELPAALAVCQPLIRQMVSGPRLSAAQVRDEVERLLQDETIDQLQLPSRTPPAGEDEETGQLSPPVAAERSEADEMVARIEARLQGMPEPGDAEQQSADTPSSPVPISENQLDAPAVLPGKKAATSGVAWKLALVVLGLVVGLGAGFAASRHLSVVSEQQPTPPVVAPEGQRADLAGVMAFWRQADYRSAEQELMRLLEEFPDDYRLHNNRAALQVLKGELDQARQSLERAVQLEPEFAVLHNNLSAVYTHMARDSYGRALQLDAPEAALYLDLFTANGVVHWAPQEVAADTIPGEPATAASEAVKGPEPEVVVRIITPETPVIPTGREAPVVTGIADTEIDNRGADNAATLVSEPATPGVDVEPEAPATGTDDAARPVAAAQPAPADSLRRWAAAWSTQDVETYLSFYAPGFDPGADLSRGAWETQRRQRLTNPDTIEVTLADFQVRELSGNRVEVEVMQEYRSDRYADRTRKLFVLVAAEGDWLIEREESLEVFR